jgi:hypothetical protein
MDLKIKAPVFVEGRAIVRGAFTEVSVARLVVKGIDGDGYVCLDVQPLPIRSHTDTAPPKRLGGISAKKLLYEVFRVSNGFQVRITGSGSRRTRFIDLQNLMNIHHKVSRDGSTFNQIRAESKKVTDALQLKAALAVLEVTGLVECNSDGKNKYYRKVKEWSLEIFG